MSEILKFYSWLFYSQNKNAKLHLNTFLDFTPGASLEIGPQRNIGIYPTNYTPLERARRADSKPLKSGFLGRPESGQKGQKYLCTKKNYPHAALY